MRNLRVLISFVFMFVCTSHAEEIKSPQQSKLEGSVLTAGKYFMDPGPDYKPDTHLLIEISGKSAEQVFNSLNEPEKKSKFCPWKEDGDCFDRIEKEGNGIYCLKTDNGFGCKIYYDLVNKKYIQPTSFVTGGDI